MQNENFRQQKEGRPLLANQTKFEKFAMPEPFVPTSIS